jgi:hypothetical protein
MDASQIADLLFKTIGSIAATIAIFQLYEVRKKRNIDMYWKISDMYKSEELQDSRRVFHHDIPNKLEGLRSYIADRNGDAKNLQQKLIDDYQEKFHDAPDSNEEKAVDRRARRRISFLNQTAILLRKRLIDKDMLLELIGSGFEVDYPVLEIVLKAHRQAHNFPDMYKHIEYLQDEYRKWRRAK